MIGALTRSRWAEKARFLAGHVDRLSAWEAGLLASVVGRLRRGSDLTMQQSISLTETFDRVQREVG